MPRSYVALPRPFRVVSRFLFSPLPLYFFPLFSFFHPPSPPPRHVRLIPNHLPRAQITSLFLPPPSLLTALFFTLRRDENAAVRSATSSFYWPTRNIERCTSGTEHRDSSRGERRAGGGGTKRVSSLMKTRNRGWPRKNDRGVNGPDRFPNRNSRGRFSFPVYDLEAGGVLARLDAKIYPRT